MHDFLSTVHTVESAVMSIHFIRLLRAHEQIIKHPYE